MANQVIEEKGPARAYEFGKIIEGMINLNLLSVFGDEASDVQTKAIEKLIWPEKFEIPRSKIKDIVDRYETTPSLARAWELRIIMSNLSNVVEPKRQGKPLSECQPIRLRDAPVPAYYVSLWDTAKRHLKTNTTLQSLAMRIYLEQLQQQGVTDENQTISDRSLKRDLEKAGIWERITSEDEKLRRGRTTGAELSEGPLIWYRFSEGWKVRRQAAKTKAKRTTTMVKGVRDRKKLT